MSHLEIVAGGVMYRNPLPGHQVVNAYLPVIQELANGDLLCIYRRGTAFYSSDGVLAQLRSVDGGATWKEEPDVWDSRSDSRRCSYSAPFLARVSGNDLVLTAFRVDCSDPGRLMVNPATGAFLPVETLLFRSFDNGFHWSSPQMVQLPDGLIAHLAGPVVELRSDRWFLPFDVGKAYDDPHDVKPVMLGLFSGDQGRTWNERHFFADGVPQDKAHWHGRVIRLADGRLFTLLWTRDLKTGRFVDVHRIVSDENGLRWETPQPTQILGQTSWPVDVGRGRMVAIYTTREAKPPGIRAILSNDSGQTWDSAHSQVLWDATGRETIGVAAKDTYPVSHDVIAFGRPQASPAQNGDVLASFWCTEECLTQIRWCRLRVV